MSYYDQYEKCPHCLSARGSGNIEAFIGCRDCGGKGVRRRPSSYRCNKCGGPMCPDVGSPNAEIPHGLVDASVMGGYDSTHLTDLTRYQFSLCEGCLRELFEGFKIPPATSDHTGGPESYAKDSELYAERVWRAAGDHIRQLHKGQCNVTRHCSKPAVWRIFHSSQITQDAICEGHRNHHSATSTQALLVPFEKVITITSMWGNRTDAEKHLQAEAWLTTLVSSDRCPCYWKYVPSCIGELLNIEQSSEDDHQGMAWVPNGMWVISEPSFQTIPLANGIVIIGPRSALKTFVNSLQQRVRYPFEEELGRIRGPIEDE